MQSTECTVCLQLDSLILHEFSSILVERAKYNIMLRRNIAASIGQRKKSELRYQLSTLTTELQRNSEVS